MDRAQPIPLTHYKALENPVRTSSDNEPFLSHMPPTQNGPLHS